MPIASDYTRTGVRRAGDDYQDMVALDLLVDWLEHPGRYRSIQVEADDSGFLDDITAQRSDDKIVLRQVKFSAHPEDNDDAWTWRDLTEERKGARRVDGTIRVLPSLLKKWGTSLSSLGTELSLVDAAIVTNRRPSPELRSSGIDPVGYADLDKMPSETRDLVVGQLGSENTARTLLASLRFETDKPGLADLEDGVRRRFLRLGGTEPGWANLKNELRGWVRHREQPLPDGTITLSEVRRASLWHLLRPLPQHFAIPGDYVLPSDDFHSEVVTILSAADFGCLVLAGSPGVGKSTYVSYLYNDLSARSIPAIRHHYFLTLNDRTVHRLDHRHAAESLMHDLARDHAAALGDQGYQNPTAEGLSDWLRACGSHYNSVGQTLIVMLDGLDHVWREKRSIDELTLLLDLILPAPTGVAVLLATQPVDDDKLPPCLHRAAPRAGWINLRLLGRPSVLQWVHKHGDELTDDDDENIRESLLRRLADAFFDRSRGHPLHLHYSLRTLQEQGLRISEDAITQLPGCPHDDIVAYYTELWRSLPEEGRGILHLLAACPWSWPRDGVLDCLDPRNERTSVLVSARKQVEHLLTSNELGLRPFHSSLLVFVSALPDHSDYAIRMRRSALDWLESGRAPEFWVWAYEWGLRADLGNDTTLLAGPSRAWVTEAIAQRRGIPAIGELLSRSLWSALQAPDRLPRAIQLGTLHDYATRVSPTQTPGYERLLLAQLALNEDPYLLARLHALIEELSSIEISYLSEVDGSRGDTAGLQKCVMELSERSLYQERQQYGEPLDAVRPILQTDARRADLAPDSVVDWAIKNRPQFSARMLDIYSTELRVQENAASLLAILEQRAATGEFCSTEPASKLVGHLLTTAERRVVLRQLVLLSMEKGIALDTNMLQQHDADDPFVHLYVQVRGGAHSFGRPVRFPIDVIPTDLKGFDYYDRSQVPARWFSCIFFCFLANHLRSTPTENKTYRESACGATWIGELLAHLDVISKDVATLLSTDTALSVGQFFKQLSRLERPDVRDADDINRYYINAARSAAVKIGLDLYAITSSRGCQISPQDISDVLRSGYADGELFLDMYLALRRRWLSPAAVDWLIQHESDRLENSIVEFPSRSERFASLAFLAATHGVQDKARALIRSAASSLLGHGNHKDMILDQALEAVAFSSSACGQRAAGATRAHLLRLAPAIACVRDFTDGDETSHLASELGTVVATTAPEWIPAYYQWLCDLEEYQDALSVFRSFVGVCDLSDGFSSAVASTAVDAKAAQALAVRAGRGDQGANAAFGAVTEILGSLGAPDGESPDTQKTGGFPTGAEEGASPRPEEFPPEQFPVFLAVIERARMSPASRLVEQWTHYWSGTGKGLEAIEALERAALRGERAVSYDTLFGLTFSLYGRDRAYRWLVRAFQSDYSWGRFFSHKERAQKRWQIVRDNYGERWFEFIRDTNAAQDDLPRWVSVGLPYTTWVRLLEYCVFIGRSDIALNLTCEMVDAAVATVSDLSLPCPAWMTVVQAEGATQ